MRSFFFVVTLSVLGVGCAGSNDDPQALLRARGADPRAQQLPGDAPQEEKQLLNVSLRLQEAISRGDVIANPHSESGEDPYVFVSAEKRDDFLRALADAGLTVPVALPVLSERTFGGVASSQEPGSTAQTSCGAGCVYQTVGYCEGGLLDGQIHNLGARYGAYTYAFNYIAGSMVPFSAELALPYSSSTVGDYNYSYTSPRKLYIEAYSNLSSANRSKHRCCYWFWGSPSWTIQCSQYFYNQL